MSKEYYPLTGRVKYSINYTEGKKNGTFERYNENGLLRSALSFKMDIIDGEAENEFAHFYTSESAYLWQEYDYDEDEIRDLMGRYDLRNIIGIGSKFEFKDGVLIYAKDEYNYKHIFSDDSKLTTDKGSRLTLYRGKQEMGGYYNNGNLFGLCEQKGKCEDKIYSILNQTK